MKAVKTLRGVSFVEGISTLALFLVAMPLKYLAGIPEAVWWTGRIHGGLVVLFCFALVWAAQVRGWDWQKTGLLFAASLVPFGFLWIEARLRRECG